MWLRSICVAAALVAFGAGAPCEAEEPPIDEVPAAAPAQATPTPTSPATTVPPRNVLGRSRPAPMPTLPPREAPRAHVSIVSPQQSRVHKRARGIRTQDGDGITDGAARDETSGPTVERLE